MSAPHEDLRGVRAMEASIIEDLGMDAPLSPVFEWGSIMGGLFLRLDLADMAKGEYVGVAIIHEAEVEVYTIVAMLRVSIALTRGDFAPEDGFTG